mgnify:CR=1 FL=1
MIHHRLTVKKIVQGLALILSFFIVNVSRGQDGRALFNQNCAVCHNVFKKVIGPELGGVEDRGPWKDRKKLYAWIHNPAGFMANDPYTQSLKSQSGGMMMTAFPQLTEAQIDAIINHVNTTYAAGPGGGAPGQPIPTAVTAPESDNTLLYGVLTLILAIVALILLQVNSTLKKLSDDKEGIPSVEPIPFYRNKLYIALTIVVLFIVGGYFTIQGAIGLGRTKNYEPVQPIYYSHKVHAGINQINCLYCHSAAQESKQSGIPSVNVCMNCHMAINEYVKGPKIYKADGSEVNGTAEIQKLYKYAGWDPDKNEYTGEGKPIEWIRIHNLPDHVYFNHSQHIVVGKQQCQTCHGPVTQMDEVYQFGELNMGWCINCHRETKVQFTDNKFYSIYEKFHEDIKNKKLDSVTVEMIGGTECQKCHY